MTIFLVLCFLFIGGSLLGYIIEVFFRRFVSMKRWINPGFLKGPYLPIYGFGITFFYIFSNINYIDPNLQYAYIFNPIIAILVMGILMTLLELIGGLIFIKGLNIKLWDYSNMKGNYKGIICPLFSFIWLACGAIYYFALNPFMKYVVNFFENNIYISFFVGVVLGLMIFDFINSYKLSSKIGKIAKENKLIINLEKMRVELRDKAKKEKEENKEKVPNFLKNVAEYCSNLKNSLHDKMINTICVDPVLAKEKEEEKKKLAAEQAKKDKNE